MWICIYGVRCLNVWNKQNVNYYPGYFSHLVIVQHLLNSFPVIGKAPPVQALFPNWKPEACSFTPLLYYLQNTSGIQRLFSTLNYRHLSPGFTAFTSSLVFMPHSTPKPRKQAPADFLAGPDGCTGSHHPQDFNSSLPFASENRHTEESRNQLRRRAGSELAFSRPRPRKCVLMTPLRQLQVFPNSSWRSQASYLFTSVKPGPPAIAIICPHLPW